MTRCTCSSSSARKANVTLLSIFLFLVFFVNTYYQITAFHPSPVSLRDKSFIFRLLIQQYYNSSSNEIEAEIVCRSKYALATSKSSLSTLFSSAPNYTTCERMEYWDNRQAPLSPFKDVLDSVDHVAPRRHEVNESVLDCRPCAEDGGSPFHSPQAGTRREYLASHVIVTECPFHAKLLKKCFVTTFDHRGKGQGFANVGFNWDSVVVGSKPLSYNAKTFRFSTRPWDQRKRTITGTPIFAMFIPANTTECVEARMVLMFETSTVVTSLEIRWAVPYRSEVKAYRRVMHVVYDIPVLKCEGGGDRFTRAC
eukprot:PhF_6_TR37908/c0_g1_i2/m.56636